MQPARGCALLVPLLALLPGADRTPSVVADEGIAVVVPAPGHTPGSVIVFLALPGGRRLALVGDLVWQREGITLREERPWLMRALADRDPAGVSEGILRMAALAARFPELEIVPAHDARAFAALPPLRAAVQPRSDRPCRPRGRAARATSRSGCSLRVCWSAANRLVGRRK